MAHLLVTSLLRVAGRTACGLRSMTCLLPQQASRLWGARLSLAATSTKTGLGRTATFGNLRWLSSSAANLSDIRQQIDERLAELFKDFDISPVFIEPALPSTPAKDVSEAPTYMDQLDKHYAAIIEADTAQHPLISVTHEELVQPILKASKKSPGRDKAVVFTTRGSGTGKTRALVECQLALMQHKDKNVLPIAITFNNKTAIDEVSEGLKLHDDPHMAYAIMVCSRILSTFYGKRGHKFGRSPLLKAIAFLDEDEDFQEAAKDLYRATLAHTVRRMRQALPEQPVDTVVLMVDETYMAHEAVGGRGTTVDYSSNLRQALLDEKLFSDGTDKVDVALCISSLVPLNFKTESGRAVVALPLSGRVSAPDVVAKWWLPAMLGKQEEDVQRWIASPENELNVKRLQVLAETMAPVPRHLQFALEHLTEHCVDQGGKVRTELDSFRRVMAGVFESVKARYDPPKLPLDILRAAIYQEEIFPVSEPDNSKRSRIEMREYDIARCIASSLIVNNEALSSGKAFIPEVSLLMAAYCMQDGNRLAGARSGAKKHFRHLGQAFLEQACLQSGDSLESCTAWMLQLRLLLLRPMRTSEDSYRQITLREIFGQDDGFEGLESTRVAFDRVTMREQLPHSTKQQAAFLEELNSIVPAPGEAIVWAKPDQFEGFDHLLAVSTVDNKDRGEDDVQHKPFLVFIDDKSRHPFASSASQDAQWRQADNVQNLILAASKQVDIQPGSLLEALNQNRACFIYHHAAKLKRQADADQTEQVDSKAKLQVHHFDLEASERFLGPMWHIYNAIRVADALPHSGGQAEQG